MPKTSFQVEKGSAVMGRVDVQFMSPLDSDVCSVENQDEVCGTVGRIRGRG